MISILRNKKGPFLRYVALLSFVLPPLSPASAASITECMETASWWLPSDETAVKTVAKWQNKEVRFLILSRDDSLPAVGLVEASLNFISRNTGITMTKMDPSDRSSPPELLVAIDHNVVADSGKLKQLFEKFLEKKLGGSFHVNAEQWDASLRRFSPRCLAFNAEVNDKKNVALLIVEEGETAACVNIGLSEAFGVLAARNSYTINSLAISDNALGAALSQLYAKTIRSGMSASEALEQMRKDCGK